MKMFGQIEKVIFSNRLKNLTTFHWIYVYGNKEAVSAKRNAISAFSSQSPSADNCFLYSFAKQNELFLLESIQ